MSFDSNVAAALLKNKEERDAKLALANGNQPVPATSTGSETSVPNVTNIKTPVIQPVQPSTPAAEAVPSKPVENVKPTEKPNATPETPAEPAEEVFQWDANIPDLAKPTQPESSGAPVDLKKLGSAFNLEVKSEDELVSKVNERLAKLKELETQSLDGLPEQLKQAAEIARKGGDWFAYTNATALDATKLDPLELFQKEYERTEAQNFKLADGSVDWEKLDEAHDSIPEAVRRMQGNQIKSVIANRQQQQVAAVMAQTVAQQERFQKNLGDAAKDLTNLLPREQFGILIESKHSSYLYEGINNGSLIKKHLGDIDPSVLMKLDGKKLMKTIAIAEFGEGISESRFKQGKTAGKKELLTGTTNAQLQSPSYSPTPNEPNNEKPSSTEMLKNMNDRQKPKNSL
jgi:hypothetical protein